MEHKKDVGLLIPFSVFLGGIGGGIVFPILPIIGIQFGVSAFFIGVILSANKFARLFCNQLVGFSIDRFGAKNPLILGLFIESVGSVLYVASLFYAHGFLMLLGRIIWGVGSAFLFISANTIALNMSVRSNRGKSTAKVRIALSLGVPAGLVAGGILSSLFGNIAAFLSSAFASLFSALLVWRFYKESGKISSKVSIGLKESFFYIFKNRNIATIGIGNMLTFFALQGVVMATLVLFVRKNSIHFLYPDARFSGGVIMAFMMVSSGISGVLAGRVVDKLKIRSNLGFPSAVIVFLGFVVLSTAHTSAAVILALIMLGVAIGVNNITLLSILGDITDQKNRGKAVAVYQLLGDVGGTIGPVFGIQLGVSVGFGFMYLATGFIFLFNLFVFFKLMLIEKQKVVFLS